MHYPDGQPVLFGDHVRGHTYNQKLEVSGVVTRTHFQDGIKTCNVYVSFLSTHHPWASAQPVVIQLGDYTDPAKLELVRRA